MLQFYVEILIVVLLKFYFYSPVTVEITTQHVLLYFNSFGMGSGFIGLSLWLLFTILLF